MHAMQRHTRQIIWAAGDQPAAQWALRALVEFRRRNDVYQARVQAVVVGDGARPGVAREQLWPGDMDDALGVCLGKMQQRSRQVVRKRGGVVLIVHDAYTPPRA